MRTWYTEYVNHMISVFLYGKENLTDADDANNKAVEKVIRDGLPTADSDMVEDFLRYVFNEPMPKIATRVMSWCDKNGIERNSGFSLLGKLTRDIARARGIL